MAAIVCGRYFLYLANGRAQTQWLCVDMCLRDGRDFQSLLRGDLLVALDIAFGIDDDSFTAALATDQVGILREIRIRDLSKKHTAR